MRVANPSYGKLRSISSAAKTMPSPARICCIKRCGGQKVSSGKLSVPSPSWFVTSTNSYSGSSRAMRARALMQPGKNANLSRLSTCWLGWGSARMVPSRSINNTFFKPKTMNDE